MSRIAFRLCLPLQFPYGAAPGDGKDGDELRLARDGKVALGKRLGRIIIRGSSMAGVLRHEYRRRVLGIDDDITAEQAMADYFGAAVDEDRGLTSPLEIPDLIVNTGASSDAESRRHNLVNRHTGVVIDKGLFSLEVFPPSSTTTAVAWFILDRPGMSSETSTRTVADVRQFLTDLAGLLSGGVIIGGNSNRGVGLMQLTGAATLREYDLSKLDDRCNFMDDHRTWRASSDGSSVVSSLSPGKQIIPINNRFLDDYFDVIVPLAIPRGQDILVGGGVPTDAGVEPQSVVDAAGIRHWRLPGSALRGPLKAWITHLAAKEKGKPVADSYKPYSQASTLKADDVAWPFVGEKARSAKENPEIDCPVTQLFGSLNGRGRITIFDSYSKQDREGKDVQKRTHVTVDRLTGGAIEGRLFDNRVVVGRKGQEPLFSVRIRIWKPTDDDLRWLEQALKAIDMGILRIGSSKASGRLEIRGDLDELLTHPEGSNHE